MSDLNDLRKIGSNLQRLSRAPLTYNKTKFEEVKKIFVDVCKKVNNYSKPDRPLPTNADERGIRITNYKKELVESYNNLASYVKYHHPSANPTNKTKLADAIADAKVKISNSLSVLQLSVKIPSDFSPVDIGAIRVIENQEAVQKAFSRSAKLGRSPTRASAVSVTENQSTDLQLPSNDANTANQNNFQLDPSGGAIKKTLLSENTKNTQHEIRESLPFSDPLTSSTFHTSEDSFNTSFDLPDKERQTQTDDTSGIDNLIKHLNLPGNLLHSKSISKGRAAQLDPFNCAESTFTDLITPAQPTESDQEKNLSREIAIDQLIVQNLSQLQQQLPHNSGDESNQELNNRDDDNSHDESGRESNNRDDNSSGGANPPGRSQEQGEVNTNNNRAMALSLSDILHGIPDFSSKNQDDINKFIAQGDLLIKLSPTQSENILAVIRTKLVTAHKIGNVDESTWDQIKEKIRDKYKAAVPYETAQERLLTIKQHANETLDAYAERVRKLLGYLNAASTNTNSAVQDAQWALNEDLAVRKFKQNIFDEKIRMLALGMEHKTLTDAIAHAVQKYELFKSSNVAQDGNKQSNQNQSQNQGKNGNGNANNASKNGNGQYQKKSGNGNGGGNGNGNKSGNWKNKNRFPPCEHCQRTDHTADRCFKKQKQNGDDSANGKPQKFNNGANAKKNTNSAQIAEDDVNQQGQAFVSSAATMSNSYQLQPYHLN